MTFTLLSFNTGERIPNLLMYDIRLLGDSKERLLVTLQYQSVVDIIVEIVCFLDQPHSTNLPAYSVQNATKLSRYSWEVWRSQRKPCFIHHPLKTKNVCMSCIQVVMGLSPRTVNGGD